MYKIVNVYYTHERERGGDARVILPTCHGFFGYFLIMREREVFRVSNHMGRENIIRTF